MIKKIAVWGTGRIGSGEATLISGNSMEVVMIGHSRAGQERCRQTLLENWNSLIRQGLVTEENRDAAMRLVTITDDPAAAADCQFIFEAVSENLSAKSAVYQAADRFAPQDAILASCTSSIPAEDLAALTARPERFLIAHPFQPVHMLPLVEIAFHAKTDPAAVQTAVALLEHLKRKVVVLNRCVPGFLVNRLAQALFRESIYLIEQGITTAADIDLAVKYAVGMRYASIGLMEYFDDVGFSLEEAIAENVYPDLCDMKTVQQPVRDGITNGSSGRASGRGFYSWADKDTAEYDFRKQAPYLNGVREWNLPL